MSVITNTLRQVRESPRDDRPVTAAEFAGMLRVSAATLTRWRSDNRLPPPLPPNGKLIMWDRDIVLQFVDEHGSRGSPPPVRDQLSGAAKPEGVPRYEALLRHDRQAHAVSASLMRFGLATGAYQSERGPVVWVLFACGSVRPEDVKRRRARLEGILQQGGAGLAWAPVDMPDGEQTDAQSVQS